jgi:HEAT repeat protein
VSRKKITTSVLFALLVVVPSIARGGMDAEEIRETLRRASAEAISIPKQAEALALLAWPKDGPADAGLQSAARERLVRFGHNGLPALRKALSRVDSLYTADVTAALIAARWRVSAGDPAEFLPGLSDALWYGSADAQRLAMLEMSRFRFSSAVSGIIDAAQAHPHLTRAAIGSIARMGDPRGRFFLRGVLDEGRPRLRREAADALARLGESGTELLREAVRSPDSDVRSVAMAALLPVTTTTDLTMLYEYVADHADVEPDLRTAIQERAEELELQWQQEMIEATEDS